MKVLKSMLSLFVLVVASFQIASCIICCEDIKSEVEEKELAYNKLCSTVTSDLEKCCEDLEAYVERQRKAYETLCPEIKQFRQFDANFLSLGASGRLGPTTLGSYYVGKDNENMVTLQNGTQFWTVPYTGTYEITAVGAAGGYDVASTSAARGQGAYMKGDFDLKKGDVLKVLVGQEGGINTVSTSAGGGGGSFVATSSNTPLIIAGGGGGIQILRTILASCDASTGTSGNQNGCKDNCTYNFPGGVNGNGEVDTRLNASPEREISRGGGGGFYSNGAGGKIFAEGGRGFIQGGEGGRASVNNAVGGFGGGGGAVGDYGSGAGGGGGYSGGAPGSSDFESCGGGGGSYNIGKNQVSKQGFWAIGDGYVEIKRLA